MTNEEEIPVIVNQSLMTEPGPLSDSGWRMVDRWLYDGGSGMWGDDAVGGFTMYYEQPGTPIKAEISYYVEPCQTLNQPKVRDAWHVEMHWEVYQRANDDDEPVEIESGYDYGSVLYYDTFESAWKECERLAKMDESGTFAGKD